jgi:hypothetical protein
MSRDMVMPEDAMIDSQQDQGFSPKANPIEV